MHVPPHHPRLTQTAVENLMYCYETCPDAHAPRKELLISTRNMIGSNLKAYVLRVCRWACMRACTNACVCALPRCLWMDVRCLTTTSCMRRCVPPLSPSNNCQSTPWPPSCSIHSLYHAAQRHVPFFCRHLYPRLDSLIDERFLLGTGQLVQETLGDFAMAMTVELVHNLRTQLDYDQLVKVVHMLCRCAGVGVLPCRCVPHRALLRRVMCTQCMMPLYRHTHTQHL